MSSRWLVSHQVKPFQAEISFLFSSSIRCLGLESFEKFVEARTGTAKNGRRGIRRCFGGQRQRPPHTHTDTHTHTHTHTDECLFERQSGICFAPVGNSCSERCVGGIPLSQSTPRERTQNETKQNVHQHNKSREKTVVVVETRRSKNQKKERQRQRFHVPTAGHETPK